MDKILNVEKIKILVHLVTVERYWWNECVCVQ